MTDNEQHQVEENRALMAYLRFADEAAERGAARSFSAGRVGSQPAAQVLQLDRAARIRRQAS